MKMSQSIAATSLTPSRISRIRLAAGLVSSLLILGPARGQVNINIEGLSTSDQFTVTGSGSQDTTPFTSSSGTITEMGTDFLNNTINYNIPVEAGSTLMAVSLGSAGIEEAVTFFVAKAGPPQNLNVVGGSGALGGFNTTISASGTGTFIIPGGSPEATVGTLFNAGTYSFTSNGVTYNYIITITTPAAGGGGSGESVVVARRAVVVTVQPVGPVTEVEMDPVTILDVDAQISANTSGQAVSNSVNQGNRGTFTGFTNGVSSHINGITGFGGLGSNKDTASARATTQLNVRIAGASNRWEKPSQSSSLIAGVMSEPLSVETYLPQWELYTVGAFNLQDQDAIGLDPGYTSDSFFGGVGLERLINSNLLIGFATTLGKNFIEAGGNAGGTDIDGVVLDAYGIYARNHFWTSLRYGVGFMDLDINRNAFPGQTARAETDSLNHVVSWGTGMNLPINFLGMEFIHGPNLGLDYTTGKIDGYRESGAGAFNLIVDDHAYGSLLSEVGWTLAKEHNLGKFGSGWLQLRASWNHEHLLDESNTEFQFETSPISVFDPATGTTTAGPDVRGSSHNPTPQNDYMSVGLHLTQLLGANERWVLRSGYQTQLFRSDFSEHYGYVRLGFQF